jgi:hypothetical protein
MKRQKVSRLQMEHLWLYSGLMTGGSALLAAACLMNLIEEIEI